jgi:protein-tyrosine-phosphatase
MPALFSAVFSPNSFSKRLFILKILRLTWWRATLNRSSLAAKSLGNKPKLLTQEMANKADLIVTMGCGAAELCPGPFFKDTVDWVLEDPKGKSIDKVREIRDEIERRVKELTIGA